MAATHLRFSRLPSTVTSGLPTKVVIKAHQSNGEVDTNWNGKLDLVPSRSLADDSFDDRHLGSWRMASKDDSHDKDESLACSIVRSPPNPKSASPFCMNLVGGVGDAKVDRNWEKGCQRVFDHIRPTRMSLNVRTSSNERESLAIFVTGPSDRVAMVFTMRSNGKMGVEEELIVDELGDPHTQLTVPYKPDTWYQIEFAFDWQRKVFDFFVDGAEIATSVPFENQRVNSLGKMFISNSHPESETFVGDIWVVDDASRPSISIQGPSKMEEGTWVGYLEPPSNESSVILIASSCCQGGLGGIDGRSAVFRADSLDRSAVDMGNITRTGKDFLDMLGDETMSDLTLVVEGRRIPVHRAVLFARCPSFRSMLTSGMRECAEKDLEIEDAEYRPFYALLQYVYSGCSSLIEPHIAIKVLKLADRYILQGLVRACEAILVPTISKSTVASLLEAADLYSAHVLHHTCISFIVKNFQDIVHLPEYAKLDAQMMLTVQKALAPHVASPPPGRTAAADSAQRPRSTGSRVR